MTAAADGLLQQGDALLADGDLPAARLTWLKATSALHLLPPGDALAPKLQARLGLSALGLGQPLDDDAATLLQDCGARQMSTTLRLFVRDVPTLWLHVDELRAMARRAEIEPRQRESLLSCARHAPFSEAYSLGRDAVSEAAVFPFPDAVELVLG